MKKPLVNYAFIDGTNLHQTMRRVGWNVDYRRFRVYLSEHYGVSKAYYFIGYMLENEPLYAFLRNSGYELIFKPVLRLPEGEVKGNCDAELVLQAMIDYSNYEEAVIVSSDGDFYCLVNYLRSKNKLRCVLSPRYELCSKLLRIAAGSRLHLIEELKKKIGR